MNSVSSHYDVCIAGGGFAGIAAAVQAARQGLRVLLIEKNVQWGGVAAASRHQFLCGLYPSNKENDPRPLNAGFCEEIESAFIADANAAKIRMGKVTVLKYQSDRLHGIFSKMIHNEKNITAMLGTSVSRIFSEKNRIKKIEVVQAGENHLLEGNAFIDCSGSGAVVLLSGASYERASSEHRQLAAFACQLKGVQGESPVGNMQVAYHLAKAADQNLISSHLKYSVWLSGPEKDTGVLRISVLPRDDVYELEEVKKHVRQVHQILQKSISEFKYSTIAHMAESVSEREGLRMNGRYTLNEEDVISGRKFADGCVKNAWPIEFWHQEKGPRYEYLPENEYYEIPERCLQSKDIENLFAGGRCISASPLALASARVTGACLATGESAGLLVKKYLDKVGAHG